MTTWTPWMTHDGRGCPCIGAFVQLVGELPNDGGLTVEDGIAVSDAAGWTWTQADRPSLSVIGGAQVYARSARIVRYRIRLPEGVGLIPHLANTLHVRLSK